MDTLPTTQQWGLTDPAPLSLLSSETRVLGEAASWSERGTRAICPLEAGVDSGGNSTFVERIAVLWENIAGYKENPGSPHYCPVGPALCWGRGFVVKLWSWLGERSRKRRGPPREGR